MSNALDAAQVRMTPWWLELIEGILLIVVGVLLLTQPAITFFTIVWFVGIYWIASGVINIIKLLFDRSMWGWKLFAGVVAIVAGWILFQHPIGGGVAFGNTVILLLGLIGIGVGVVNLIQAFRGAGWGTGILGVVSIFLGIILLANRWLFTFSLPWALGLLAIVGGLAAILGAFRTRSRHKELERANAARERAAAAQAARTTSVPSVLPVEPVAAQSAGVGAAAAGAAAAAAETASEAEETVVETAEIADEEVVQEEEAVQVEQAVEETRSAGLDIAAPQEAVDPDDAAARVANRFPDLSRESQAKLVTLVAAVRRLDPESAQKLRWAGIENLQDLLERGATRQGRAELAQATGIDASVILKWVNDADLARIKGIGVKYSDLLETAGVDTVVELAQRNPDNLHARLVEVNVETNLVKEMPTARQVADWVEQAKGLPRMISY